MYTAPVCFWLHDKAGDLLCLSALKQATANEARKKNPKPLGSGLKISSLRWIKEGSNIASGGR